MNKESHDHDAAQFGKSSSGSISGLDAPMIGASSMIIVDGITEQESGKTPPPPPVSVKALAIALIVMLVIGIVGTIVMLRLPPPVFP